MTRSAYFHHSFAWPLTGTRGLTPFCIWLNSYQLLKREMTCTSVTYWLRVSRAIICYSATSTLANGVVNNYFMKLFKTSCTSTLPETGPKMVDKSTLPSLARRRITLYQSCQDIIVVNHIFFLSLLLLLILSFVLLLLLLLLLLSIVVVIISCAQMRRLSYK